MRQDVTLGGVQSATTYAYDAANQLVSSTQGGALSTYSYDANGNLVVRADGSGATTFVWDGENRLVRIEYPGGQTTGNLYTADGLRQSRSTSDGVTGYVWDGVNVLEELDGSGAEQRHRTKLILTIMESANFPRYYNFEALRFVRDNHPTEPQILSFFGGEIWEAQSQYASFKRSGMVIMREERWFLRPEYLSADGKFFRWDNQVFHLDDDRIDTFYIESA